MRRVTRPFGSWPSEIAAGQIAAASLGLSQPRLEAGQLYWLERRPTEGGRQQVLATSAAEPGAVREVTPRSANVRTRVHEYGGGDYVASQAGIAYVDFADQRIYLQRDARAAPLSLLGPRHADLVCSPDGRWLVAVEEAPRPGREPENRLVAFALPAPGAAVLPREPVPIAAGHDFYSFPCFSPGGDRIAYTAWDHPDMPWDRTRLFVQAWGADGPRGDARQVAGGEGESVFQPRFSPSGVLTFVSDRSGWWNLYQLRESGLHALCPRAAEFGGPQWVFGLSRYAFISEAEILCAYGEGGRDRLARLQVATGALEPLDLPYIRFGGVQVEAGQACFVGESSDRPAAVVSLTLASDRSREVALGSSLALDAELFSCPELLELESVAGRNVYAYYHAPRSPHCEGPMGAVPPLLVKSHGGPTSATSAALDLRIQYWVSRGIAVVDVDYGGSTGYGRAYRERLRGRWGVVDVEDCVHAALRLAEAGRVDRARLAISGGSAGGYTTLCALTFHDVFAAGASHYGIGDLEALRRDTHKFEARYLDGLVGPYPEKKSLYRARSPIHFAERLSCPVIFFQGLEDEVVPPNQAEAMVAALARRGLRHAYVPFAGEQHGFRRAENIRTALEGELYFYGAVFGFEVDARPEGVEIVG